jgi:hypothetical protein
MTDKHKGGKGKKASYTTSVMRVPDPVKSQVESIIQKFHEQREAPPLKVNQIEASVVIRLFELISKNYQVLDYGYIPTSHELKNGYIPEDTFRDLHLVQEYMTLADQVNKVLWQIDNSWPGLMSIYESSSSWDTSGDPTVYQAVNLLIEYRLIKRPDVKPATLREVFDWYSQTRSHYYDWKEAAKFALVHGYLSVFAALYECDRPIDRASYWDAYYKNNLAKPDIDFWSWRGNPEINNIPELVELFSLPEPNSYAKKVLLKLPLKIDPFFKMNINNKLEELFKGSSQGYFAQFEGLWEQRKIYYNEWRKWHEHACHFLGQERLNEVYFKVFGVTPEFVEYVGDYIRKEQTAKRANEPVTIKMHWSQVLGISRHADPAEVKKAYRNLCKQYHPDVNKSPEAEELMKRVNNAYAQWEKQSQSFSF